MSTLAFRLVDALASTAEQQPHQGLLQRFIKAREESAARVVRAHLTSMDNERLRSIGFSDEDIRALRAAELGLPR